MAFFLSSWFSSANALTFLTEQEAAKTLVIQYKTENHDVISGKIINNSLHPIRDPEVLVEYHWLWAKEFKPGSRSPGRAAYVKLDKEIQPGESVSFTYRPEPPLPDRSDGRFMPEVSPAGFSVVMTPQRTALSH
jgi:hypothetical protein